jgi:hypothetical protein
MKTIITLFSLFILFNNHLFSQNKIEKIDSSIYIITHKKNILIKSKDEFIFVYKIEDSLNIEEKYYGNIIDVEDSLVVLDCYYYTEEIIDSNIISKNTTILNNEENLLNLKINDFNGFYYSPNWKLKTNEISKSLFFSSLFIGLVIAPIISFEYRKINTSFSGFNRKLYTNTLIFSFVTIGISIPMYYISKPKYFKLI